MITQITKNNTSEDKMIAQDHLPIREIVKRTRGDLKVIRVKSKGEIDTHLPLVHPQEITEEEEDETIQFVQVLNQI